MKRTVRWQKGIGCAVLIGLIANPCRLAQAGWTGAMNGIGFGWASVSVTSAKGTTTASTQTVTDPSASIPSSPSYDAGNALPRDASPLDFSQILGSPGYVWHANTLSYDGDGTDNTNIESLVTIVPYDCPALTMDSTGNLSKDGLSGVLTVNATGTPGTALLLRGYEYTGPNTTPQNLDDLRTNSMLKFDVLLVGPFELTTANCTAIVIPFTTQTGTQNLYFVADGVAKSNPLTVTCSTTPVVIGCGNPVQYPNPVITGGCGGVQYTFDPTPANLPLGVVATVTVTAVDGAQNTASCTFMVDTTAKAFTATYPANVVFGCGSPLVYPSPQITGGCGTFSYGYVPEASALVPGVPTIVKATVTDQTSGFSVTSQFTATREALTFNGFDSPIGGTGGSCGSPLRTVSGGSVIPVKFTDFCNGSPITTGTPTLSITDCAGHPVGGGNFQMVANEWHFNWDTTGLTTKPGKATVYELVVTLQDRSTQTVFVGLK